MCKQLFALLAVSFTSVVWAVPEGPEYPSPEWTQRETANYAKVLEAPAEQATNPVFMQRFTEQGLANFQAYLERSAADPSWNLSGALNTPVTPLCTTWSLQCAGDPFRYPGVDPFYENEAEVESFVYYDQGCARISGRVWKPKGAAAGLPAVVIENGSVQAPEPLYWWAAQLLVRSGYVVMTFDPRGQGRSDQQTPGGEQGSNANAAVFWEGLVNAIDFFRSSPVQPYPHNETCAGTYPTEVTAFNPFYEVDDPDRLGIAGHSLGAVGVSIVQGYGATGADSWPGMIDAENPVKVAVAWDGISVNDADAGGAGGALFAALPPELSEQLFGLAAGNEQPLVVPRVPIMGQNGEYGLTPAPFLQAPNPEGLKNGFHAWREAGLPVFELTIQGSSHYEWSLLPTFPTSSWCPEVVDGQCAGGWGQPLAQHYTLAWFDRWLKKSAETGYETADARLTADADWTERMSFYYRSARDFPSRGGQPLLCEDIRGAVIDGAPCDVVAGSTSGGASGAGGKSGSSGSSGGGCALAGEPAGFDPVLALLVLLAMAGLSRHRLASSIHKGN